MKVLEGEALQHQKWVGGATNSNVFNSTLCLIELSYYSGE
jgi:hypothetical protein